MFKQTKHPIAEPFLEVVKLASGVQYVDRRLGRGEAWI